MAKSNKTTRKALHDSHTFEAFRPSALFLSDCSLLNDLAEAKRRGTEKNLPDYLLFLCPSLLPFGGSTVLETYSSTTSRSRPVPRGNRSAASCLCTVLRRALYHYVVVVGGCGLWSFFVVLVVVVVVVVFVVAVISASYETSKAQSAFAAAPHGERLQGARGRASSATNSENKAFAILHKTQEGKPALIKQDGGEMLVALILDKPSADVNISRQSSGICDYNYADSERETASRRHSPDGCARRSTCFTIYGCCVAPLHCTNCPNSRSGSCFWCSIV